MHRNTDFPLWPPYLEEILKKRTCQIGTHRGFITKFYATIIIRQMLQENQNGNLQGFHITWEFSWNLAKYVPCGLQGSCLNHSEKLCDAVEKVQGWWEEAGESMGIWRGRKGYNVQRLIRHRWEWRESTRKKGMLWEERQEIEKRE